MEKYGSAYDILEGDLSCSLRIFKGTESYIKVSESCFTCN